MEICTGVIFGTIEPALWGHLTRGIGLDLRSLALETPGISTDCVDPGLSRDFALAV